MYGMAYRPYTAVESRLSIVPVLCATIAGIGLDGRAGVRRRESEFIGRGVRRFIQGREQTMHSLLQTSLGGESSTLYPVPVL